MRPFLLAWWIITCTAIGAVFAQALWATHSPDEALLLVLVAFGLTQLPVVRQLVPGRRAWWWVPATAFAIAQGSAILATRAIALTQVHSEPFGVLSMVLVAPAAASFAGRIQARVLAKAHLRATWRRVVSLSGVVFLLYITYAPPGTLTPPLPVIGPDGKVHYQFGPPVLGFIDLVTLHGMLGGLLYGTLTAVALWYLARNEAVSSAGLLRSRPDPAVPLPEPVP